MAKKSSGSGKVGRSNKTGRFVTTKKGEGSPKTTVVETVRKKGSGDDPPHTTKGKR